MPDGTVRSPLDELLGFEKYQRRSYKAKEQLCALASSVSYRKTARINSYISQEAVSASTVCRAVREVGQRIENQEAQFQAEAAGKVKAPILFGEADGVWISLQKANKRKMEVRMAIAYTGKRFFNNVTEMRKWTTVGWVPSHLPLSLPTNINTTHSTGGVAFKPHLNSLAPEHQPTLHLFSQGLLSAKPPCGTLRGY